MKWVCDRCKAINAQFAPKCHNCGKVPRMKLGDGTYLCCPGCGDEDASEGSESKAMAGDFVKCPTCGEEYKAEYDSGLDKFLPRARTWTRD